MAALLMMLTGCIWSTEVYRDRLDAVTDDDGDGWNDDAGDCDDRDPEVSPGTVERCDNRDQDCDGVVDEDAPDASTWYVDLDGDGFGGTTTIVSCSLPDGAVDESGDCDDADSSVYPGAADEPYDGVDGDCAGGDANDLDGDGYPGGDGGTDCDDGDAGVYPGAEETWADGVTDNDCDGEREATRGEFGAEAWAHDWPSSLFGREILTTPDVDGDGGPEVVAAALADGAETTYGGAVFLLGPAEGGVTGDCHSVRGPAEPTALGVRLAGGGDLDGDSQPDIVVSGSLAGGGRGSVWGFGVASLVQGDLRLPRDGLFQLDGVAAAGYFGSSLLVADIVGDGMDSLLVGAPYENRSFAEEGVVYWYSMDGVGAPAPTGEFAGGFDLGHFGTVLSLPGDVDGDGYSDVLIGSENGMPGVVAAGGPAFSDGIDPVFRLWEPYDGAAWEVFSTGDVDGDGRGDIGAIGPHAILAFTYLAGNGDGTPDYPSAAIETSVDSWFGVPVRIGDIDADGTDDLAVTAMWFLPELTSIVEVHTSESFRFGARAQLGEADLLAVSVRGTSHFGSGATLVGGSGILAVGGDQDDQRANDGGAVTFVPLPR